MTNETAKQKPVRVPVDEERSLTAQDQTEDWVDHYLAHVPFEDLYRDLFVHIATELSLFVGHRLGQELVAILLEKLIRTFSCWDDTLRERVDAGDLSLLRDFEIDFDWQEIAADFAHLFAFARYGYGRHIDPANSRAEIQQLLAHFKEVVAVPGIRAAAGDNFAWLEETYLAADARWEIDHGRSVTPEGLAVLAGLRSKTIANLLAAREITIDSEGRIPAAEAQRYLERRKDFHRSTWQEPVESNQPSSAEPPPLGEQVFVPLDSDGNPFLPSLARRGRDGVARYTVGPKSEPEFVEDYWEALELLARMAIPRWRRPPVAGKGGWSLVSGQEGWRRFPRADLQRMIEAMRRQEG